MPGGKRQIYGIFRWKSCESRYQYHPAGEKEPSSFQGFLCKLLCPVSAALLSEYYHMKGLFFPASGDIFFQGNNHSINGGNTFGGFVLSQGSNFNLLDINNCKGQIYNNSYFAGAIFNTGGTSLIQSSAFNNNYADASGFNYAVAGAVYNTGSGNININSSLFYDNYAHGASAQGGAIGNDSGVLNVSDSIFSDNYTLGSAVSYGGAFYNGNRASTNIKNSLFNNNSFIKK